MRHKNKDAKENKRRTRGTTKAGERARLVQEQMMLNFEYAGYVPPNVSKCRL